MNPYPWAWDDDIIIPPIQNPQTPSSKLLRLRMNNETMKKSDGDEHV